MNCDTQKVIFVSFMSISPLFGKVQLKTKYTVFVSQICVFRTAFLSIDFKINVYINLNITFSLFFINSNLLILRMFVKSQFKIIINLINFSLFIQRLSTFRSILYSFLILTSKSIHMRHELKINCRFLPGAPEVKVRKSSIRGHR